MIRVRELEVWGYPGIRRSLEEGDFFIKEIERALYLPDNSLIPYHSIPDDTDVENLSFGFSERELLREDFVLFCNEQNLDADPTDSNSANEFLTYWYGQKLAWLHLPEKYDTDVYLAQLSAELKQRSCALIDPELLICLVQLPGTEIAPTGH